MGAFGLWNSRGMFSGVAFVFVAASASRAVPIDLTDATPNSPLIYSTGRPPTSD